MALSERIAAVGTTSRLGRRELFGVGGASLFVGWAGTQLAVARPGLVPGDPLVGVTALWFALFAVVGAVTVTQCPDYVRFSRPLFVWGLLNAVAFVVAGLAALGSLPPGLVTYAFWHVWVLIAVVGFAATGALLERSGASGQHYFTASGLEVSLLFIGFGAYGEIVPGSYLLLAFVHPTPLLLDALPDDVDPGPAAVVQLGLYALGLGLVLVA